MNYFKDIPRSIDFSFSLELFLSNASADRTKYSVLSLFRANFLISLLSLE